MPHVHSSRAAPRKYADLATQPMSRRTSGTVIAFILGAVCVCLTWLGFTTAGDDDSLGTDSRQRVTTASDVLRIDPDDLTLAHLFLLTPEQLEEVDPLLMNLAVLKGIPKYENVDADKYVEIVDEWARQIEAGLEREEERTDLDNDPLYAHDPDLWRAGGMILAVAGPSIGVSYTARSLDAGDATQGFLPGLIDTKRGTCANMPVLYLALAHRLEWPLKAVVSRDHLWCRWDDGSKQFNLEATDAESDGEQGSFATPTDEEYARQLGTPALARKTGSDFASLTAHELLGVFLQARAGYWMAHDRWDLAEHDLCLARTCFPMNRDIFLFLTHAMAERAGYILTEDECRETGRWWDSITRSARRRHAAEPDYPWDTIRTLNRGEVP